MRPNQKGKKGKSPRINEEVVPMFLSLRNKSQRPHHIPSGPYLYRVSLAFSEDFDVVKLADVFESCSKLIASKKCWRMEKLIIYKD